MCSPWARGRSASPGLAAAMPLVEAVMLIMMMCNIFRELDYNALLQYPTVSNKFCWCNVFGEQHTMTFYPQGKGAG